MDNPILIVSTNKTKAEPLYNQAFFNYPGIQMMEVNNDKPNRYIMHLHNEFVGTPAIVLNISQNVLVFDTDALFRYITFLIMQGNIEVAGLTASEGIVDMGSEFNVILPKTKLSGKNYFAQMHQLEKDCFISYSTDKGCPGILLHNHKDEPFAVFAGSIKYFKSPKADFDACYEFAKNKKQHQIELERA